MCKFSLLPPMIILAALLSACTSPAAPDFPEPPAQEPSDTQLENDLQVIPLPEPAFQGDVSLEKTLNLRRSVRNFKDTPLTTTQIGQLMWSAQGITHPAGLRTAPSAGALYPLEVYAATQEGLYRYNPTNHSLEVILSYDPRPDLHQAALRQDSVRDAPLVIVITAVFSRTAHKYGDARTPRYVYLEAGHAAQNILLQAVALELGSVPIGAFYDDQVTEVLSLPADETPLYLIPVGHPE